MINIIKKIPLPITGLMLALAGLGNLVVSYGKYYRNTLGIISGLLLIFIVLRLIVDYKNCLIEFDNPIVASVVLTFPMGIMILSTYIKPYLNQFSLHIWYFGIFLHIALLIFFSFKYLKNLDIKKVYPTYFIVYVGIVVGSVTAPIFNNIKLGQHLFYFGFLSHMILLPIVLYRVVKIKDIKKPAIPTITIFTAPAGLCLAGYMSAFPDKNIFMLSWLIFLTFVSITGVTAYLPKMISKEFYPSYSAFTFPFVITAIGLKLSNKYLLSEYGMSILKYPSKTVEILSIILVIYVLFTYMKFILTQK
ncbi:MAG: TDT family transporter [Bacillota bacterium]